MAGSLRAALVLAALAQTVSANWRKSEEFSDAACTTSVDVDYSKLQTCQAAGRGMFYAETCASGKIKTVIYNDTACTEVISEETANSTCEQDGSQYEKKGVCVDALPAGFTELELEFYASSTDCSGTPMAYSSAVKAADVGTCKASGDMYAIESLTASAWTRVTYTAAGCSGTPNKTETRSCGSCTHLNGESTSSKIPCSSMAKVASALGVASHATAVAASKVMAVTLASIAAFLA